MIVQFKFVSKLSSITLSFGRKDCKVFIGTSCIARVNSGSDIICDMSEGNGSVVTDNIAFARCPVVRYGNVNSIQNPSTVTNPTMGHYCILLLNTLPCCTTWQIAKSLLILSYGIKYMANFYVLHCLRIKRTIHISAKRS